MRFLVSAHEAESAHHVVMSLMGPEGELGRLQAQVAPVPEEQRASIAPGRRVGIGIVFNLANVVFPEYGGYHLAVTWDGTEVREPIRLFVIPPPQPPQ